MEKSENHGDTIKTKAKMDFEQKGVELVPSFTKLPSSMKIKHWPLTGNKEVYGHLRKTELLRMSTLL